MTENPNTLFVAWQNQTTRRFYPVARLRELTNSEGSTLYEFVYIQGALEADGFHPFVSFPDLHQTYLSQELFPLFDNRLVSPKRTDYPAFLADLGLPSETRNPITILSRSTGRRVTDTLQLFPMPEYDALDGYRTTFWAHGIRHLAPASESRIATLVLDEAIRVCPDPDNPVAPDAMALWTDDGIQIGYMPSYLLDDAHDLNGVCGLTAHVDRLNPAPAPVQQRLLLRLESCWPPGFTPYSSKRYQPIPESASILKDGSPEEFDSLPVWEEH